MTSSNRERYILLSKGYGRPVSRREWDSVAENPRSKKVLQDLRLDFWHQFMKDTCGYNVLPFTKDDVVRFGRTLGTAIDKITPQKWDEIVEDVSKKSDQRIPTSNEINELFYSWGMFKIDVKKRPKDDYDKKLEEIENLFFESVKPINIARRIGFREKEILKYLESVGLFTREHIEMNLKYLEAIMQKQILRSKVYDGEEKQIVRDFMNDEIKILGEEGKPLRYCGLPGVNFIDYAQFAQRHGINPAESLVAESERELANVMVSIKRAWDVIDGGEIFRGLHVYRGYLEKALAVEKYRGMKFNVFNLDWVGAWGKGKQKTFVNMFKYDHVDDRTLIFITLNDSRREQMNAASSIRGYRLQYKLGDEHIRIAGKSLEALAEENGFRIREGLNVPYCDTIDMICAGYILEKK